MPDALSGINVHLVDDIDTAHEFLRWLGERRPENMLAMDIETGSTARTPLGELIGVDDTLSPWHSQIRMIQVGDRMTGWAIPYDRWSGVYVEGINRYFTDPKNLMAVHHLGMEGKYMALPEHRKGAAFPWGQLHDTMLMSQIVNPDAPSHALKNLADLYVSDAASVGQKVLKKAMRDNGWDWTSIPYDYRPYWTYSAIDPIITARVCLDVFWDKVKPGAEFALAYETEMQVRKIATDAEVRGARIDLDYVETNEKRLKGEVETLRKQFYEDFGISPSAPAQVGQILEVAGAEFSEEQRTDTGAPKTDVKTLEKLLEIENDNQAQIKTIIDSVLTFRDTQKLHKTYFSSFLAKQVNGFIHPNINIMGATTTGRMCLPETHKILTRRGLLDHKQVRVGDKTLDRFGQWVDVTDVHLYRNQKYDVLHTEDSIYGGMAIEATPEHKWVTGDLFGEETLGTLADAAVQGGYLRLAPEVGDRPTLRPFGRELHEPEQHTASRLGVLAALLVHAEPKNQALNLPIRFGKHISDGLRHYIINSLPEQVITSIKKDGKRIVLDFESIFDAFGVQHIYRDGDWDFTRWLLSGKRAAARTFLLTSYWLSDKHRGLVQVRNDRQVTALDMAAYMMGISAITVERSIDRIVRLLPEKFPLQVFRPSLEEHYGDVWCVTTETGTFTAWSEANGLYLTGNSSNNPNMQNIPSRKPGAGALVRGAFIPREDDHGIISVDFDQMEFRLTGAISNDENLIRDFAEVDLDPDGDLFTTIMRQVFNDPTLTKDGNGDKRDIIKTYVYASLYGAGIPKLAAAAGIPIAEMRDIARQFSDQYPGVARLGKQIEQAAQQRIASDGRAWVRLFDGRKLYAPQGSLYKLQNYLIQGTGAIITKRGLIEMDKRGLTEFLIMPVHDEVVLSAPISEAREVMTSTAEAMSNYDFKIPLTAGPEGYFDRWGDKYDKAKKAAAKERLEMMPA